MDIVAQKTKKATVCIFNNIPSVFYLLLLHLPRQKHEEALAVSGTYVSGGRAFHAKVTLIERTDW